MAVEDFKRWHWIAIGLVVGPAFGYAWASLADQPEGGVAPQKFERELVQKDQKSGQPLITGIVVHPSQKDFTKSNQVNVVAYKRLAQDSAGRIGWVNEYMIAPSPYTPAIPGRVPADPKMTILSYLDSISKAYKNDPISFRYGWWLDPKNAAAIGAIIGVLLIGGVWPTLLNVMIGAGLGKRSDPNEKKEPAFAWLKAPKSTPAPTLAKQRAGPTAEDERRLRDIDEAYDKAMAESGSHAPASGVAGTQQAAEVRKLEAKPLEAAKPMHKPEDDDEIEVKGEFYPVLIHHKKDDSHKDVIPKNPPPKEGK